MILPNKKQSRYCVLKLVQKWLHEISVKDFIVVSHTGNFELQDNNITAAQTGNLTNVMLVITIIP